jgi:hypothetical protein
MSPLTGTVDANLLELGPANVYFDSVHLGFLGDDLGVTVAAEAQPLTGAQTGTIPQDKVVTGGSFRITVPLKEISMGNFARAFPNAVLTSGGATGRLDFQSRVGLSMRSLAKEMQIIKIKGGVESTIARDKLIIPLCSPVDAEVTIPYSPTEQRVITASFEAWPDSTGRWAYISD